MNGFQESASATSACKWDVAPGWVQRENQKTGAPTWSKSVPLRLSADFSRRVKVDRVEGWFEKTSATCGESINLHIVGKVPATKIDVFRMGYYDGAGARLISSTTTKNQLWKFRTFEKTPPGQYLFRLSAPKTRASFVPLVVRNSNSESDLSFVSSVLTWQSYNQWGGSSLYKGTDAKRETHAESVSFNRPYDGDGSGQFRYMEFPALKRAEKLGLDINYLTDIDLDAGTSSLGDTKAIVFGGHGEYWTKNMRQTIEASVAKGINLISLGGNTGYNFTELGHGARTMGKITPWRSPPNKKPESLLWGSQYFALNFHQDYVVTRADRWPFNVLKEGEVIKGIAGNEVDSPLSGPGPGVEELAHSTKDPNSEVQNSMATYYRSPSGAGVLNLGTNGWVCALENVCPWGHVFSSDTQEQVTKVTDAIFSGLKKGPLGNWRSAKIDIPTRL
ncbi:MAG: hypothetical protein D4R50_02495 [Actinomycetales bacterium]|nr:MAG: hypothetical protein D4R50_02495 [Actinomycetales bacterium]